MRVALCALALTSCPAAAAPFNSCGSGVCFSGNINHNAILQRAPERSAVYGSVNTASPAGAQVVVTLAGTAADGSAYSKDFPAAVNADSTYKALLDAMPAWGNFTITATCSACAGSPLSVSVVGVTFGDVYLSSGQSNMELSLYNTYERNISLANVRSGMYANIRVLHGGYQGLPPDQDGNWILQPGPNVTNCSQTGLADGMWCSGLELAQHDDNSDGRSAFFNVRAVPWYFAERLTDLFLSDGGIPPPPIGLVFNPVGGTMVEQWTPFEDQLSCASIACMCTSSGCNGSQPLNPNNQSACSRNGELWRGQQQPFVNMTLKGFLWYQQVQLDRRSPHPGA